MSLNATIDAIIPIGFSASSVIKDSISFSNGKLDVRNTTSTDVGINVGTCLDGSYSNGRSHSYFDKNCDCNFWEDSFGDKSKCSANQKFTSSDVVIGVSLEFYFGVGAGISIDFNITSWAEELASIFG